MFDTSDDTFELTLVKQIINTVGCLSLVNVAQKGNFIKVTAINDDVDLQLLESRLSIIKGVKIRCEPVTEVAQAN